MPFTNERSETFKFLRPMSDLEILNRIQAFLAAPAQASRAFPDEVLACEDFFQVHDLLIRSIVRQGDISQSDVDDVVQEIWALLVRRLPKLDLEPARGTLHAWVAAVARHHAGRHARRLSRRCHEDLTPDLIAILFDPALSPAAVTERKQQQSIVQAVIDEWGERTPAVNRKIIVEYWINERSISAIASELQMAPECVWSIIRRARPALLDRLRRAGLAAEDEKTPKKYEILDR
jgi:RNA polymerase sigma factor (sigma-70 family)